MSSFWLLVFIAASITCVVGAVIGAVRTRNGLLGVVANISIPLWFISVIAALAIPRYPGWHPIEIAHLSGVITMGLIMLITNNMDNNKTIERLNKKK